MENVKPRTVIILLATTVIVALVLRVSGVVDSFWWVLGLFALLSLLGLIRMIPIPRIQGIAGIIYVFSVLAYVLWPAAKDNFLDSRPETKEASDMRHVLNDLELAEVIRPNGLRGIASARQYCNNIEQLQEGWYVTELAQLEADYRAVLATGVDKPEPDYARQDELNGYLLDIKRKRDECMQAVLRDEAQVSSTASSAWWGLSSLSDWPAKALAFVEAHWLLLIGILISLVLVWTLFKGTLRTTGKRLALALLVAAIAMILYQNWGQISQTRSPVTTSSLVPAIGTTTSFTFDAGELEETLECGPGVWYQIWANQPIEVVQTTGNITRPANEKFVWGGAPGGIIKFLGTQDGTTAHLQRVQVNWK